MAVSCRPRCAAEGCRPQRAARSPRAELSGPWDRVVSGSVAQPRPRHPSGNAAKPHCPGTSVPASPNRQLTPKLDGAVPCDALVASMAIGHAQAAPTARTGRPPTNIEGAASTDKFAAHHRAVVARRGHGLAAAHLERHGRATQPHRRSRCGGDDRPAGAGRCGHHPGRAGSRTWSWLALLASRRHEEQRRSGSVHLKGPILPGERKSVEPMAACAWQAATPIKQTHEGTPRHPSCPRPHLRRACRLTDDPPGAPSNPGGSIRAMSAQGNRAAGANLIAPWSSRWPTPPRPPGGLEGSA